MTTIFSQSTDRNYAYNANGSLTKDLNRQRTKHTQQVFAGGSSSAGGNTSPYLPAMTVIQDSTDYVGNLILRNGHPSQYLFAGGYVSFSSDTLDGYHYYIQDYMGNNRMVVNGQTGATEQVTHYYPYGGVIGDISYTDTLITNDYKFEGKELDRTFGLDWYDIHARQYDAIGVPGWNKPDQLAEKYYGISPYVMCAGNPVNLGDYDGMDIFEYDYFGNQINVIKNDKYDQVIIHTEDGIKKESNKYNYSSIKNVHVKGGSILKVEGDLIGTEVFEFLSDNTKVEFGQIKTGDEEYGLNFVSSLGSESLNTEDGHKKGPNGNILRSGIIDVESVREVIHSHPNGSNPSGFDTKPLTKDAYLSTLYPNVSFSVYIPISCNSQIRQLGIKYLPFKNGKDFWSELIYSKIHKL